ncbi:CLUMA_CG014775, isoform A [Clunio marinus]|uniref:CLUMA_CG014775, isoform A n=1 Tax=Clunio marinus TaxID=568069 RepID=A0A1J1IN72_9DIPT|nr:CLUMA_CG014775, isoform A [Clunio marinus]
MQDVKTEYMFMELVIRRAYESSRNNSNYLIALVLTTKFNSLTYDMSSRSSTFTTKDRHRQLFLFVVVLCNNKQIHGDRKA